MSNRLVFPQILLSVCPVFFCFVGIGATISVVPSFVGVQLGFGSFIIGLVVASQYFAMLLFRPLAGAITDVRGPKTAIQCGVFLFLLCGLGYLLSAKLNAPASRLIALLCARFLLGIGESYIITGVLAWAIHRVGQPNAGLVMAWNGNAMYGGVALGAPLGTFLNNVGGFEYVAWVLILLTVVAVVPTIRLEKFDPLGNSRASFGRTLKRIAEPGFGLFLATVGYGVILGFSSKLFLEHQWGQSSFSIFCFGCAYVGVRIVAGRLPDRFGGSRVAFWSFLIEVLGQLLLFWSPNRSLVLFGSLLSGAGFSLVVPSLGVEVVRRVTPQDRGSAMAGYLAFFDLAFGVTVPLAGLFADAFQAKGAFGLGFFCAALGTIFSFTMRQRKTENRNLSPLVGNADVDSEDRLAIQNPDPGEEAAI